MNKTELIAAIAQTTGFKKSDVERMLTAMIEAITKSLKRREKVSLIGFGTFSVQKLMARMGINPKTREKMKIPASNRPKFTPGKALKEAVNK